MTRKILIGALLGMALAAPAMAEESGYGAALQLEETTSIANILARPHDYEGQVVQVTGPVEEACTARGCWMRIKSPEGQVLLVKSSDESVLVPKDTAGRTAIVEGVVIIDHGKEEGEASSVEPEEGATSSLESDEAGDHTCPEDVVRLETRGVVLL